MKNKKLGFVLLGLFMVLLLAAGIILIRQFSQPLGPTMTLSSSSSETAVPGAPAQIDPTATALQPVPQTPVKAPTEVPAAPVAATAQTFCGQTGKMVVLVVGDDADPALDPPGSDLVRYVQVDYDQQKVTIFAFPRSLWVKTPVLADQKINATTLGKSYHFALLADQAKDPKPDEKQQVVDASQAVAQTVLDNFGLKPDHYAAVKVSNLPKLVDAVDGVTVDNPYPFTTAKYDKVYTFAAGPQTLNGLQTTAYVRFISADHPDLARISRQNLVLKSLYKKLEDPAILPKVPGFFTQLADSIVTDLSAENVTDLTCVLKSVAEDHIVQENVHPDMISTGPEAGSQLSNVEKVKELLKSLGMLP